MKLDSFHAAIVARHSLRIETYAGCHFALAKLRGRPAVCGWLEGYQEGHDFHARKAASK